MSNKKIKFEITTPERVVYSAEIDEVVLPTMMGEIGVLPNHIPLVSILKAGELRVKNNGQEESIAVSGGFIEVRPDKVLVLADTAEKSEEIDEQKAEQARVAAQKIVDEKRFDNREFAALTAKIEKELVRLKVARKRRRRPNSNINL